MAREVKESARALAGGGSAVKVWPTGSKAGVAGLPVGEVFTGEVTSVRRGCVFVDVDGVSGIVPKGQISKEWVDDARDFAQAGQSVRVKVIGICDTGEPKLSMRQCG